MLTEGAHYNPNENWWIEGTNRPLILLASMTRTVFPIAVVTDVVAQKGSNMFKRSLNTNGCSHDAKQKRLYQRVVPVLLHHETIY